MVDPENVDINLWREESSISVFESMRVYDGVIFKLDEHLDRLLESAKSVGIRVNAGRELLRNQLAETLKISGHRAAFVRITVAKDRAWIFAGPLKSPGVHSYKKGVVLRTVAMRRPGPRITCAEAKVSDYLAGVLAKVESDIGAEVSGPIFETVFLSSQHEVEECRTSNIFMVKGNRIFTPPPREILDGVTRRTVLELAADSGIPVLERVLTRHDLYNAEEVFLTYTSGEILPVSELDRRKISSRCPGPLTQLLHRQYKRLVKNYVARKSQ